MMDDIIMDVIYFRESVGVVQCAMCRCCYQLQLAEPDFKPTSLTPVVTNNMDINFSWLGCPTASCGTDGKHTKEMAALALVISSRAFTGAVSKKL